MFTTPKKTSFPSSSAAQATAGYLSPLQGIFRAVIGSPGRPSILSSPLPSITGGALQSPVRTSGASDALTNAPQKKVTKRKRCIPSANGCDCSIQKIDPNAKLTPKTRPIAKSRAMDPSSPVSPSPMPPPVSSPQRNELVMEDAGKDTNPTPSKRARMTPAFRAHVQPLFTAHISPMGSRDPPSNGSDFPQFKMRTTPIKAGMVPSVKLETSKAEKIRVQKANGLRKERSWRNVEKARAAKVAAKIKMEDVTTPSPQIPIAPRPSPHIPDHKPKRRNFLPMTDDDILEMNFTHLAEDVRSAFSGLGTSNASPSKTPSSSSSTSVNATPGFTRTPSSSSDESSGPSTPLSDPIEVEFTDEDRIFQRQFLKLSKQHIRAMRLVDPERAERISKVFEDELESEEMKEVDVNTQYGVSEELLSIRAMLEKERDWSANTMKKNLADGPRRRNVKPEPDVEMESEAKVKVEVEDTPVADAGYVDDSEMDAPVGAEEENRRQEEEERQRQEKLEEIRRLHCARVEETQRKQREKETREAERIAAEKIEAALKEKTRMRREREELQEKWEAERKTKEAAEFARREELERERLRQQRRREEECIAAQLREREREAAQRQQLDEKRLQAERIARAEAEAHARILAAETVRLQRIAEEEQARRLATEQAYMERMMHEEMMRRLQEEAELMRNIREEAERAPYYQREVDDILMRDASFYVPPRASFPQEQQQPQPHQQPTGWSYMDASMASIPADDIDIDIDTEDNSSSFDSGYGSSSGSQSQSYSTSPTSEYDSSSPFFSQPPPHVDSMPSDLPEPASAPEPQPVPYTPSQVPITAEEWIESYEARWGELTRLITTSSSQRPPQKLTFSHIPWPAFSLHTSLDTLSEADIREFFMVRYPRNETLEKKMWTKDLRRWHTDKVVRIGSLLWGGPEGQVMQDVQEGFLRCIKVMNMLKQGRP